MDTEIWDSTESWPWRRNFCHQDLNPRPFVHESGILTTKPSLLPKLRAILAPHVASTWSAQSTCNRNKKDTHSHVAHKHTHTHACTCAHTHIYTHTYTHTHTHAPSQPSTPGIVLPHVLCIFCTVLNATYTFFRPWPVTHAQKNQRLIYSWQATDMNKWRKYYIHSNHTLAFELPSLLALYFNS